ncbi:MAG: single-stranded-DNA-specific exonuclease RecJ [Nitrospirae bacterium CG18_big_fil_WC_8_21_14_2_50_70_55]|nr:single-stranded-DNA-specific exonuclease RecJ [Deltaproteobacteria bacterium]NCS74750.1 single-stranded-DNA-specific exonuclease RecJ [Deltaproteobacteria bacterium]PIQ06925.1 MAG: single-stranded-DNA-specific exonuclease RecJ [Nitrospirae bacterium CG18_big_fil_WC_8_21_14_2_50_70_55]HBB40336.1 single-stranded-DNA-specific exonuclease RecJ [Pseudomonadota bacterium]
MIPPGALDPTAPAPPRIELPAAELEDETLRLAVARGITLPVARILVARGITGAAVEPFLTPRLDQMHDPLLLADLGRAAARLADAVVAGEAIGIFADYDVDGVTSCALLTELFTACGAPCHRYLPDRLKEGYGLNGHGLELLAEAGCGVVVTVDCGINGRGPAERAKELGLDLIITDHHEVVEPMPDAFAVVNPKRPDSAYPFREICGVGVAFNLAVAVRAVLVERGHFGGRVVPDLKAFLDIVALGTIGDMVPLIDVNRAWVRRGLALINGRGRPGLRALAEVAGLAHKPLTAGQVAFQLAPRINALGRLGDPGGGVALLTTVDFQEAAPLAERCQEENQRRRALEAQILGEAVALAEAAGGAARRAIVVASGRWHPGVIGIVAARLVERYHRPAVVLAVAGERARGSVRSIPGVDIHHVLTGFAGRLESFGGHPYAAGLTVATARIDELADYLHTTLEREVAASWWARTVRVDSLLGFSEVTLRLMEELKRLEPFGMGNREPLFLTRGARLSRLRRIGDGSHLAVAVEEGGTTFPGVWFHAGDRLEALRDAPPLDLIYRLKLDDFHDQLRIQIQIQEIAGD